MHARYYSQFQGRFLAVDQAPNSSPLSPQSWNRYNYTRNNPLKYVDPTGYTIALAGENTSKIKEYLIKTAMRPTGRQDIKNIAENKSFHLTLQEHSYTSPARIFQIKASRQETQVTFGKTVPTITVDHATQESSVNSATMNLDTKAIESLHPDRSGVVVTAHEFYHANDLAAGKSMAEVELGDTPTSATGPAEQHGKDVAAEQPDISEEEAEQLVNQWLESAKEDTN